MRCNFLIVLFSFCLSQSALAEPLQVLELRTSNINLYDVKTGNLVKRIPSEQLSLPIDVIRKTRNNRLEIRFEDEVFAIKKRVAVTNEKITLSSECNNSFSVEKSGVHRGLGECS